MTSSSAGSSQCFPIQPGIAYAGDATGYAELPSVEACCALCERTPSCLYFTHWSNRADTPNRCELYRTRTIANLAPEHATVTSGALVRAHWLVPSAASCRFTSPESGTLSSAPLTSGKAFTSLEAAQEACIALDQSCAGVTSGGGRYRVRGGSTLEQSPTGEQASLKVGCDGAWCDLEEGAWYGGDYLATKYDVPSASACCDACLATPRCVGFNYARAASTAEGAEAGLFAGAEPQSCALHARRAERHVSVSYTHLTLPTILLV